MQNYGVGNLLDEIGLNRVMLVRTLDKMNEVTGQLSFRDHLDALRAVAYTTGRIESLLDTRERLYKPYENVEKEYREYFETVQSFMEVIGPKVYGQKKWDEFHWHALRKYMGLTEISYSDEDETAEQEVGETKDVESNE
jgi:hypothetical protein